MSKNLPLSAATKYAGLALLQPLYSAGVRVRNRLYDRKILPARSLRGPVVSVGNLSVGGSGKTPFVIQLGKLLLQKGVKFDVLSRGYGRQTRGVAVVNPSGSPQDFGDEPLLIARHLGVPVLVGEDRYEAGLEAERIAGAQLHILDDGFQHRSLARDLDIVLLTPEDAEGKLLPLGRQREPASSLHRADVVVMAAGENSDRLPVEGKQVWHIRRGIAPPPLPSQPLAFCGIAKPHNFFLQLGLAGACPVAEAVFRDHHAYQERDIEDLLNMYRQSGADGFVTTEKDEINLGPLIHRLQPLSVVPVRMQLVEAEMAVQTILNVMEKRNRPA